MTIKTKYNVGNLVKLKSNNKIWRIIAIHISSYSLYNSVMYDLEDDTQRRIVIKESAIQKIVA